MPNYDYFCSSCGASREVQRLIADRDLALLCEHCGEAMTRSLTAFAIGKARTTPQTEPPVDPLNGKPLPSPTGRGRCTGIRIEGGGGLIEHCTFNGIDIGVSISEGTSISMKGNEFINVPRHVDITKRRPRGGSR